MWFGFGWWRLDSQGRVDDVNSAMMAVTVVAAVMAIIMLCVAAAWFLKPEVLINLGLAIPFLWLGLVTWSRFRARRQWRVWKVTQEMERASRQ